MESNSPKNLPRHVAIIMDGNGRWAAARGWPRILGHREGARNVRRMTTACQDRGIKILTLYAFSAENWTRPTREISMLMQLLKIYAVRERTTFMKNQIRFQVIGDTSKLPSEIQKVLKDTIEMTASNKGLILQLALSYGGRDEILRAVKAMIDAKLESEAVTEENFSKFLDTSGQIEPDLIIRTSGELRLSNFLIWQSAYSEFYFTDTLWPDFNEAELDAAFADFRGRQRRFGAVDLIAKPHLN